MGLDFLRHRVKPLRKVVDDEDLLSAFRGESQSCGASDATPTTCNQNDFPGVAFLVQVTSGC